MKFIKEKGDFGLNIFLADYEKYLAFTFGGNGDLYWSININGKNENSDYKHDSFIITKENYDLYRLFEELFLDIENINIFGIEDDILFYIENDEEKRKYLENRSKEIEDEKRKYRLYNFSNYNELFDTNNKTITWYSDETAHEVANILKIKKEENIFRIDFYTQPYINGYDEDFASAKHISVRFRNSGSSYYPFNIIFMKMYNELHKIDDINDFGHQIHIEEYLYNQEKIKKLKF